MERRSRERIVNLEIYTDGSSKKIGKTTFGGWSFIVLRDSKVIEEASGGENETTNQRMELMAALKALEYASSYRQQNEKVVIYSDSAYLVNCYLKDWYITWERNGWLNSKGEPVANQDLWCRIIPYFDNFWYVFKKVPGHAGQIWNEKCDKMAQAETDKLKRNWRGKNG